MRSWCTYPPVLVLVFLEDIIYCVKKLLYCTCDVPVGQEKENFNIPKRSNEMLEFNPILAVRYFLKQSLQRKCQTWCRSSNAESQSSVLGIQPRNQQVWPSNILIISRWDQALLQWEQSCSISYSISTLRTKHKRFDQSICRKIHHIALTWLSEETSLCHWSHLESY